MGGYELVHINDIIMPMQYGRRPYSKNTAKISFPGA